MHRRLATVLILAGVLFLSADRLNALDMRNEITSDDELMAQDLERQQARAAEYRLARAKILPGLDPSYHRAAAAELAAVGDLLEAGWVAKAGTRAERALERWPYADAAAGLRHQILRCRALSADLSEARRALVRLWEFHPDYGGIGTAMQEALVVAEAVQSLGEAINLAAVTPHEVIDDSAIGDLDGANKLFHFLAEHGDRRTVAPRAALGLARSRLLRASSTIRRLPEAREAYRQFLERFPDSSLVFEALCEQALSYLLAYRGDQYDLEVLVVANTIIDDQARIYAGEDPTKLALVERYRDLIKRWRQDRELQVAEWYAKEGHYRAARLYCNQLLARDPATPQAREAQRLLDSMPADDADDAR